MNLFKWLGKLIAPVSDIDEEEVEAKLILERIKETCDLSLSTPTRVFTPDKAHTIKDKLRTSYAKLQVISRKLRSFGFDPPTNWLNKKFFNSVINSIRPGEKHAILTQLQHNLEKNMKRI